jgi:hydrogenase maturation protease
VLGLGNELLRDDGVGLRAARLVVRLAGPWAVLAEACVANLDLLPLLCGQERVVVVDAYCSVHDPPGTTVCATPDELPHGFGYRSLHTMPFAEMLELGRRLDLPMPQRMTIHGLCVQDAMTFGAGFTPAVERTWRKWARSIVRIEFGPPQALRGGRGKNALVRAT